MRRGEAAVEEHPLPWSEKGRLAIEILTTYARVRWLVERRELPQTVELLRRPPMRRRRLPLQDGGRWARRLGAAVDRTLTPLPTNTLCLTRSLVLLAVLSRRNAEAELVIAVQPGDENSLDAHAWVELDGRPLLTPPTAGFGRLVTL